MASAPIINDEMSRFLIQNVKTTGIQLGRGAYGEVHEVEASGKLYAGKIIHEILLTRGSGGVSEKFLKECLLMAMLDHPNITKFLGICYVPELSASLALPVLVMEKLDRSLDDYLEKTREPIAFDSKRSILQDVAEGLVYLHEHEPLIIHRDLTARNILLTNVFTQDHVQLLAKITDFGNSRFIDLQANQRLTRLPGTPSYMPPEASSQYGASLDIFSFGHLALFTALQEFPGDLLPEGEHSEVERRVRYFEQLQERFPGVEYYPLAKIMKKCLVNNPSERFTARELLSSLKSMENVDVDIMEAIQNWNERAQRSDPIVLVLAGKAGVGKSTLLNNFLGLKKTSKAKTASSGASITTEVAEYKEEINGITVKVIDTPGLEAADLTVEQTRETIAMVNAITDGKADLLLYCVSMKGNRIDQGDVNIIKILNEAFKGKIWEKCLLILTHGDLIEEDSDSESDSDSETEDQKPKLEGVIQSYCDAFQNALQKAGVSWVKKVQSGYCKKIEQLDNGPTCLIAMPAGKRPNVRKPPEWKAFMFKVVLMKCDKESIPAMLELQGINWMKFAHTMYEWSQGSRGKRILYNASTFSIGFVSEVCAKMGIGKGKKMTDLALEYVAIIHARAKVQKMRAIAF